MGIKRPAKVQKGQKNYLTNERYQDYAENQFKTIYDFLDANIGEVLFDDDTNTKTQIDLPDLSNYDSLEIWYRTIRLSYDIRGSQKIQNPVGKILNVNIMFRSDETAQHGATSLWRINKNNIRLIAGSLYEMNNNAYPIMNSSNHTYITKITGIKK